MRWRCVYAGELEGGGYLFCKEHFYSLGGFDERIRKLAVVSLGTATSMIAVNLAGASRFTQSRRSHVLRMGREVWFRG